MKKVEYLNSKEVAELLGISTANLYGWSQEDRTKRRPFFPKPQKLRSNAKDRRLILQYKKKDVLKFIKESKEKPYYLLSEANYEKLRQEQKEKKALPVSVFNEFYKLMFKRKQKREADNA
ncbi:hypothetical protein PTQ27_09110 [Mannheimia sp. AT1]|uniref:Helix-turn-helix domain-containing protein n=1 Tax=Mannheimia cairinae TaxID=3025936 RepID=A0ABT5MRE3_9PAST|nr:hypothetical protein [Mannheimia cairinae]MDD0824615.1 hypothetical protein [Mannheimia cairinae]MDD0826456.1 hypothetical protein [Mannheimia cairinae]